MWTIQVVAYLPVSTCLPLCEFLIVSNKPVGWIWLGAPGFHPVLIKGCYSFASENENFVHFLFTVSATNSSRMAGVFSLKP